MIISPPEQTYRQNLTLRLAAFLVPAIAWTIVGIIALGEPEVPVTTVGIAILLTILWGVLWVAVGKAEVTLHTEGIRRVTVLGVQEMVWQDIVETRFTQVPVSHTAAAHFGLLGYLIAVAAPGAASGQRRLALQTADGRKLKLSENWRDVENAIRTVLQRVNPRLRQEMQKQIQNNMTVKFGSVSLSQHGITWKNKEPVPFGKVVKCKIQGTNLRIKEEDKWLDNISVNTSKVPNVFVLMDLIDEMRAGGRMQEMDPMARAAGA